jgi:hypothetical protein
VIRFIGSGTRPRVAPRGIEWGDSLDAPMIAVQVASESAMEAIPEAAALAKRTLVFVLPEPTKARGILSAFARVGLTRRARSEALLLRGYVDIGAEVDKASRLDVVYGYS